MPNSYRRQRTKSTKSIPKTIKTSTLLKVTDKFMQKGWMIVKNHSHSTFEKYCTMIAQLDNVDEENLILDLTDRFFKIDISDYDFYLTYSVNNLYRDIQCERIHVLPLVAPQDEGKVKSSTTVTYRFRGDKMKTLSEYKGQFIVPHDNLNSFPENIKSNDIVLLVDDFIGTGDTAVSAFKNLLTMRPNLDPNKVIILSLVSLEEGVNYLSKEGIVIYTTCIFSKGISEYYSQPDIEKYLNIMEKIESRLNVFSKFKLGYKQSEALISMIRTPNNTFPIFWLNSGSSTAPFPRD